jgi:ABC-2 type transport system permease protein
MSFRANFLVRCATHVVWLAVMLGFFEVVFLHAGRIGDWDRDAYLMLLGTSLTLNALVNCLFIGNCTELSHLVRTGNLDFVLLKPVDEQFLLTCQRIDWALVPQVVFNLGLAIAAGAWIDAWRNPIALSVYVLLLIAGTTVLYSLLVSLAALTIWTVRHRNSTSCGSI